MSVRRSQRNWLVRSRVDPGACAEALHDVLMSALLSAIAAAERMALRLVRIIIYPRPQINAVGQIRSKLHALFKALLLLIIMCVIGGVKRPVIATFYRKYA